MIEQLQIPDVDWLEYDKSLVLVSYRYGTQVLSEYESMESLLASAAYAIDANTSAPYLVQDAKGKVVMSPEELDRLL